MYNALDIARYIINYELDHGRTVSNLRLQKLLYFVQAQFIVQKEDGMPCFSQRMEAWDFGPVVPEVYHAYKFFGSGAIPEQDASKVYITPRDKALIDSMLDKCAERSTSRLVEITHSQAPWKKAYHNSYSNEITVRAMQSYFRGV